MNKKISVFELVLIAVLGGVAMVLMMFEFPLPFAPSFLKFDVSEIPALFAGFFIGPVGGVLTVLVKIMLNILFTGSTTAYVGEFSNFVGSSVFVLTAAFIYKKDHDKKGAILSMVIATLVASAAYVFINYFVMFPLYSKLYGLPIEVIVGMGAKVNPMVSSLFTMMLFTIFPFNIIKFGITSVVTFLIYKRSAKSLRRIIKK